MVEGNTQHTEWIRGALERYESPLLRYACRLTGNLEQARDVVQDSFVRLCRADRSKVEDHLAAWLFTVCRRRALEHFRKEGRMTALTEERMAAQQSREPDPAATAERSDDIRGLPKLLAVLPERQQEVVRLKFQNEFSYKQISEIMGLSVSNVGYLIHTAIHTLRKRAQEQHA